MVIKSFQMLFKKNKSLFGTKMHLANNLFYAQGVAIRHKTMCMDFRN